MTAMPRKADIDAADKRKMAQTEARIWRTDHERRIHAKRPLRSCLVATDEDRRSGRWNLRRRTRQTLQEGQHTRTKSRLLGAKTGRKANNPDRPITSVSRCVG